MVENLVVSVASGFNDQNEHFEKRFDKLVMSVANGFNDQNERFEKRFDKLEKDNIWIKDILESHSTILARLDQERVFTINHVNRSEVEIIKIKKHLKLV